MTYKPIKYYFSKKKLLERSGIKNTGWADALDGKRLFFPNGVNSIVINGITVLQSWCNKVVKDSQNIN